LELIVGAAPIFEDDWLLIGSAAAYVAGADVGPVNDIDLLLSARDLKTLDVHWRDRERLAVSPSSRFRSALFHRIEAPLPIEAMAGFELKSGGDWVRMDPKTRVDYGGVFAPAITEQIEILEMMGRDKDRPRISALQQLL